MTTDTELEEKQTAHHGTFFPVPIFPSTQRLEFKEACLTLIMFLVHKNPTISL